MKNNTRILNEMMKTYLSYFILPIYLGLMLLPFQTLALPQDSVQFYFDHYGRADVNDKWVRRVHHIFDQVKRVANKRHHRLPQLAVVQGFNSPDDPLAVALPDGYIVLSKQMAKLLELRKRTGANKMWQRLAKQMN